MHLDGFSRRRFHATDLSSDGRHVDREGAPVVVALTAVPPAITVRLVARNGSGETGTAVLIPDGPMTRIVIAMRGEPRGASQPAMIHAGTCTSVERARYALRNVFDGRSTTTIPVPLSSLTDGRFVINLQDSSASLRAAKDYRYVSCGVIRRS
jgi:hypothetical protein